MPRRVRTRKAAGKRTLITMCRADPSPRTGSGFTVPQDPMPLMCSNAAGLVVDGWQMRNDGDDVFPNLTAELART
jgi:hypothetical protein